MARRRRHRTLSAAARGGDTAPPAASIASRSRRAHFQLVGSVLIVHFRRWPACDGGGATDRWPARWGWLVPRAGAGGARRVTARAHSPLSRTETFGWLSRRRIRNLRLRRGSFSARLKFGDLRSKQPKMVTWQLGGQDIVSAVDLQGKALRLNVVCLAFLRVFIHEVESDVPRPENVSTLALTALQ